jgi:hypothetical protein
MSHGPIAMKWNVQAFPGVFVLDQRGAIRIKGVRDEAVKTAVDSLLLELDAGGHK